MEVIEMTERTISSLDEDGDKPKTQEAKPSESGVVVYVGGTVSKFVTTESLQPEEDEYGRELFK